MAQLWRMPLLEFSAKEFGSVGEDVSGIGSPSRQAVFHLESHINSVVGHALATMLSNVPNLGTYNQSDIASDRQGVEVRGARILLGGSTHEVDVCYRPNDVQFAFNSKVIADSRVLDRNWRGITQNLTATATAVHRRYPRAIVAFLVALPDLDLDTKVRSRVIQQLESITGRAKVDGAEYLAEVISLVLWNPRDGSISKHSPMQTSPLRYGTFSAQVEATYVTRYIEGGPFEFDVAVSFAGPQRDVAAKLAEIVKAAGYRVFYDKDYPDRLWGTELTVSLDEIYREKSRYCVMFISQAYRDRMWTHHERRSAQARALSQRGQEYILPIIVEDVELPGLLPTTGYLRLEQYDIDQIAEVLITKLGGTKDSNKVQMPFRDGETLPDQALCIDPTAFQPREKHWLHPYAGFDVASLLENIYHSIEDFVLPFTYGESWLLRDAQTGSILTDIGSRWAGGRDERTLEEAGIIPGMTLQIIRPNHLSIPGDLPPQAPEEHQE